MDADRPNAEQEEVERLAEDWITLWQSEIAALAADREAAEAWSAATSALAALGAAWLRAAAAPPAIFAAAAPSRAVGCCCCCCCGGGGENGGG
jgi:hypothetical protein